MEYQGSSSAFWATGKIEDYLKYSEERKRQACEKFISAIEGEKANDRNSNSNRDGNILHGYKWIWQKTGIVNKGIW